MNLRSTHTYLLTVLFCIGLFACKKTYDLPPIQPAANGEKTSIANIKSLFRTNQRYKFLGDSSIYGMVIADETSGNFYKEIYFRDVTGAIHLKLLSSGGLFIGDSIRLRLKGCILCDDNKLIQLDSVNTEKNIIKLSSGSNPRPRDILLSQLLANNTSTNPLQSQYVKLLDVEFLAADRNQPFGDAISKSTVNRILRSCEGQTLAVRTGGYASFASLPTPTGKGSICGILSQYGNALQLVLRQGRESEMNGITCTNNTNTVSNIILSKDFDDGNLGSGGWTTQMPSGNIAWAVVSNTLVSGKMAQCNNFISSGNQPACESWLISPALNLKQTANPGFSFSSAVIFSGPALTVYVSTQYKGGTIQLADWTEIKATLGSGSTLKNSGKIDLSAYKSENVYLAFQYKGNNNSGARWQLDDIKVFDE